MPPRIRQPAASISIPVPSPRTHCKSCLNRAFSSTTRQETRLRRTMFFWLQGPGENFRHPLPNSTNYLSAYDTSGRLIRNKDSAQRAKPKKSNTGEETADSEALINAAEEVKVGAETADDLRPFPQNPYFTSQSVLSEPLRQEVWRRVQVEGKSVRQVSVEMGIEMRRVGAVVRLAEVERKMRAEGKQLAVPYARAIQSMVPLTPFNPDYPTSITPHESINDLPQHRLTERQLFYPTSESRAFNRVDAGRVFSAAPRLPTDEDIGQGGSPAQEMWRDTHPEIIGKKGQEMHVLKPADSRIPHPHLVAFEKDKLDPKLSKERNERMQRFYDRLAKDQKGRADSRAKKLAAEEAQKIKVDTGRWQFVVTDVTTSREGTGLDGRGTKSPGFRYGVPSQDRKRGNVKIPTKVNV